MQSLADLILPGGGDAGDEGDGGAFELSEIIASSDEEMLLQGAMEGSFVEEEENEDDEEEEEEEEEEGEDAEDLDGVFECEFDCGLRGTQAEVEAHELGATVKTCIGLARRAERTRRKAGFLTPAAGEEAATTRAAAAEGDEEDEEEDDDGDDEEDEEEDETEDDEEDETEGDGKGDDEYADEDDEDEDDEGLVLGPNMPMDRSFRWLDEEFFGAHLLHDDGHRHETGSRKAASAAASAVGPRAVALEHVPRVWAPVGHSSGSPPRSASAAEVAFVGRWFVGHPADIDREVLSARAPQVAAAAAAGAVPAFMSIADALAARQ
jgi:archaellum component FlaD/FlaE